MKIAVFDYLVVPTNPAGSCHRTLLAALGHEHEFTVFASEFDNPLPGKIDWIRVPSIRRPLAALFLSFHLGALSRFLRGRKSERTFAICQSVESNFAFGDLVYSHFCHRWFLKHRWKQCGAKGLRGLARWSDHAIHALVEPWAFRHAKWIVAPSEGLARELREQYPFVAPKLRVIPNPVDLEIFAPSLEFDREAFREELGFDAGDRVVAFVALGQFELKGLPLILDAFKKMSQPDWKLVIVGGMPDLVRSYRRRVKEMGLSHSVQLVGHQKDIRPYLWSADLFALPSSYEVFSLVALQAAAAACPILVTRINGVEEFLVDGKSCINVGNSAASVLEGLQRFGGLSPMQRRELGENARRAVRIYGVEHFVAAWRELYRTVARESVHG